MIGRLKTSNTEAFLTELMLRGYLVNFLYSLDASKQIIINARKTSIMEIYIVRHGQTEWNIDKRFQGRTDIKLTEEGVAMAVESGKNLLDVEFDKVFSSPLSRAKVTAEAFLGGRNIPIHIEPRLREMSFGVYEGHTIEELLEEDPACTFQYFFSKPELYQAPEEGETFEEVIARASAFLTDTVEPLANDPAIKRVMLVGHGAINKALMCHVKKHGVPEFWSGGLQKNCNVIILRYEDGIYTILDETKIFYAVK